jgi:hypothetical protein
MKIDFFNSFKNLLVNGWTIGNREPYDKIIEIDRNEFVSNVGKEFESNLMNASSQFQVENIFTFYIDNLEILFLNIEGYENWRSHGSFSLAHLPEVYYSETGELRTHEPLNKEDRFKVLSMEMFYRFFYDYLRINSSTFKVDIVPILRRTNFENFEMIGYFGNPPVYYGKEENEKNVYPEIFSSNEGYDFFRYLIDKMPLKDDLSHIYHQLSDPTKYELPIIKVKPEKFRKWYNENISPQNPTSKIKPSTSIDLNSNERRSNFKHYSKIYYSK